MIKIISNKEKILSTVCLILITVLGSFNNCPTENAAQMWCIADQESTTSHAMEEQSAEIIKERKVGNGRRFVEAAIKLRRQRIRAIYFDVLTKAGLRPAQDFYRQYFSSTITTLDGNMREQETARRKKELETTRKRHWLTSSRQQHRDVCSPAPGIKHARITNYGRWYLSPRDFSYRLQAT